VRSEASGVNGNWIDVCPQADIKPGQARLVEMGDLKVAVFNLEGEYFAMQDICTHDGSPLLGCGLELEDLIKGDEIMCPRHGARFAIRTGQPLCPPAYEPTRQFPTRLHNGNVQIHHPRND